MPAPTATIEVPADRLAALEEKVDRLIRTFEAGSAATADATLKMSRVIRAQLLPPPRLLTYRQAVKLGFSRRSLERCVARGVFTDDRCGSRQGAAMRFYEDELREFRTGGEAGVRRLREELARD